KEVLRQWPLYEQPQFPLHRIELSSGLVTFICQEDSLSPMQVLAEAMRAYNKPAHDSRWYKVKAVDHFYLCLTCRRAFWPGGKARWRLIGQQLGDQTGG